MTDERDPKRIARAWKREVDFEIRRHERERQKNIGWGIVVWIALGAAWILLLFELFIAFGHPRF